MSTSKVIFTYKRKRLSSRSGVDHTHACTNFSLEVQADKQPDVPDKKVRSKEKDMMIRSCVNCTDVDLNRSLDPFDDQQTGLQLQDVSSGRLDENHDVQTDPTCSRKMILGSDELLDDHFEKDSCVHQSNYLDIKEFMNGGSDSQVEKNSILPLKQSFLCDSKIAKGKSITPLLTFSRRLKRKLGASSSSLFTEQSLREGDMTIKESNAAPEPSCACEVASKESRLVENSEDMALKNSGEKIMGGEIGTSCPSRQSCAESPILRHNEVTSTSQEGMGVDISPSKQTTDRISGSISNCHNLDSLQKDEINFSLNDEAVASCNISSKIDEQPLSQQLQACSEDSQLTSGGSSDLKQDSSKIMDRSARSNSLDLTRPPPGDFVIDCNVVPESDVLEEASDIIQGSSAARESKIEMPEGHKKSKGLELFGDKIVLVEDSSDGVHATHPMEAKHNIKCLQLFSDNGNCAQLTLSNTQFEISQSQLAQSNNRPLPVLGLFPPTEQRYEGQTSKDGPTIHQFQNPNLRICDFIQNPRIQSFTDSASLRHKLLLESINTRATSLQGNRNISLDNFDPSPSQPVWSEEELDSLWIGIRRYGRGHWRAMLLDPRLRFAPWRVAGELEEQWERELHKLFSGPYNRYLNPQDAYNIHFQCGPVFPVPGSRREIMTDTQLSLGNAQKLVTMASCGPCGPGGYGFSPFNSVQASPDGLGPGPVMALGMNNGLPHWLRDPINGPRLLDLPPPPSSNLGLRLVNPFPGIQGTNIMSNKLADANPSSLTKKPVMDNIIVIDSDASSEETISDDNNVTS